MPSGDVEVPGLDSSCRTRMPRGCRRRRFCGHMTLSGETPDVVPQGFALHLLATLPIPGVTRPHVCASKVAGEDLLEILPTIDRVFGQVNEPSSRRVGQVNGEEWDDEKVVICPTCPADETIVL
jgi:hypothetical protein